jgi:hypothetical protein
VIIIAGVNVFIPFLAPRGMLQFMPYLLIIMSRGVVEIARSKKYRFSFHLSLCILIFLALSNYSGLLYHKNDPGSPTGYKELAERWIPNIKENDVIFVKYGWITSPIFYYVKADTYNFVNKNYFEYICENNYPRAWVLSFQDMSFRDLPVFKEIVSALADYTMVKRIDSLRIKAELYVRHR